MDEVLVSSVCEKRANLVPIMPFLELKLRETGFFICDPHKVQVHAPLANMFAKGLLGFIVV